MLLGDPSPKSRTFVRTPVRLYRSDICREANLSFGDDLRSSERWRCWQKNIIFTDKKKIKCIACFRLYVYLSLSINIPAAHDGDQEKERKASINNLAPPSPSRLWIFSIL